MLRWTDLEDVGDGFEGEFCLLVEHGEIRWQANGTLILTADETIKFGLIHEEHKWIVRDFSVDIGLLRSCLLNVCNEGFLVGQVILDRRLNLFTVIHDLRVPTERERGNVACRLWLLNIAYLLECLDNALIRLVVDGFVDLPFLCVDPVELALVAQ